MAVKKTKDTVLPHAKLANMAENMASNNEIRPLKILAGPCSGFKKYNTGHNMASKLKMVCIVPLSFPPRRYISKILHSAPIC